MALEQRGSVIQLNLKINHLVGGMLEDNKIV